MKIQRDTHLVSNDKNTLNSLTVPLYFADGVFGLKDGHNFVPQPNPLARPFLFLDCVELENIGFFTIDPFLIYPDYSILITKADQEFLELQNPDQAMILAVVTVAAVPEKFTANLLAPLVINTSNQRGRQLVFERYPMRYYICDVANAKRSSVSA